MRRQRFAHGCRSEPLGTLCDTMRWVCGAVVPRRVGLPTVGTLRRYHPLGRNGAAAQMGRSGDTVVCGLACVLHTGAGRYRSGRFATPCGGCAWSIMVNIGLGSRRSGRFGDTIRLGRWVPGGWVGLFALVKCCTCLRCASGARPVDVRTTVGLNRLGVVRVQTWMVGVQLAHIK